VKPDAFLAPPALVISTDLATVASIDVSGHAHFETKRPGLLCGFSGWFRAILAPDVELSNEQPGSRWNHTFLPLENPISIEAGTPVDIDLESSDGKAWRWSGVIGSVAFDQTTWLAAPPCYDPAAARSR
jgi:hypothetical protein